MAKMEIRASGAAIKTSAASAIFLTGLSRCWSTVRPSFQSFLQTTLAYAQMSIRPIGSNGDGVAAFEGCALAQSGPGETPGESAISDVKQLTANGAYLNDVGPFKATSFIILSVWCGLVWFGLVLI